MTEGEELGWRGWISENFLRTPGTIMLVMVLSVFGGTWLFKPAPEADTETPGDRRPLVVDDPSFSKAGSELDPAVADKLRRVARAADHDDYYLFIGYADSRAYSKMPNVELSRRRAAAVEKLFHDQGARHTRILALGETTASDCPGDDEACFEKDRRVEIWRGPDLPLAAKPEASAAGA